jgi:hypothetical protein
MSNTTIIPQATDQRVEATQVDTVFKAEHDVALAQIRASKPKAAGDWGIGRVTRWSLARGLNPAATMSAWMDYLEEVGAVTPTRSAL